MAILAVSLSGCAIQTQSNGRTVIGLDHAEIFGQQIETFKLGDGSTGALRRLNGAYSLKFDKYARVVPIERATRARIVGADRVGDRDTVLVEKTEGGCPAKYQLISMRGAEVNTWDMTGDCRTEPQVAKAGDELRVLFAMPNQWRYVVHKDGRLERFDMKPPAAESARKPEAPAAPAARNQRASKKSEQRSQPPTTSQSTSTRKSPASEPYSGAVDTVRQRIQQAPKPPVMPDTPDFGRGEDLTPVRIKLQ